MIDTIPGSENACFRRHFLHGLAIGYTAQRKILAIYPLDSPMIFQLPALTSNQAQGIVLSHN